MNATAPESRTEKVAISVTPREKQAIQLVAALCESDVSNLIRDRVMPQIEREAEEIRGLRSARSADSTEVAA